MSTTIKVKGIIRHQSLLTATAAKKKNGQSYDQKNYSVNILISKDDPNIEIVKAGFQSVIVEKFNTPNLPVGANNVFNDCSIKDKGNTSLNNYYELRLASRAEYERPHVVDLNSQPIVDPSSIKVGDYVWVVGVTAAYDTGNGGVSCYLNATMITGEQGSIPVELLSSRKSASDMFSDVPTGVAPAPVAPAPVAPAPVATVHQMTEKAAGVTYESFMAENWTDEMLIEQGMMLPPGGVTPSFM